MPDITIRGARLHYEETGAGPETILFIHGLMLPSESWEAQRDRFAQTRRVITYDLRGQGRSKHAKKGLGLDSLAEDAAALLRLLAPDGAHVVGFSMGAFIALRLGARHPALVRSLTLVGVSADAESWRKMPAYAAMIALVTLAGVRPVAPRMMQILFGRSVLADPARATLVARWRSVVDALPKSIVRAAAASALRRSVQGELAQIGVPVLVIAGEEDRPVPLHHQIAVATAIPGAEIEQVPATGHAVMLEQPEWFNTRLARFLSLKSAVGRS
ncbi:alpha/beta fold hydrolase [Polymorphobacter sp.]|uniref:alpha/beta fold hydrolase n=1 Tax=Polymorphobacter sp. TaxID=1909290 RepID=UPI003F70C8D4